MEMTKRILLIDDEDNVRESLELILTHRGYDVRTCRTGHGILDEIRDYDPDILLLDVLLGDEDGRDICRDLKLSPETGHLPVIILSGIPDIYNTITEAGANDIVLKPFDEETLLHRIERQLE
jgi:DNA-binding response OmpR family regulator